jgi:hypothetical protein
VLDVGPGGVVMAMDDEGGCVGGSVDGGWMVLPPVGSPVGGGLPPVVGEGGVDVLDVGPGGVVMAMDDDDDGADVDGVTVVLVTA